MFSSQVKAVRAPVGQRRLLTCQDPDLSTRSFLHLLETQLRASKQSLQRVLPMLCLVDFDPHGLEILTTYKFGSSAMGRANQSLTVSSMRWLGIHSSDFAHDEPCLIPFTPQDQVKLEAILSRPLTSRMDDSQSWTVEILKMQTMQLKAEIEVLAEQSGLASFLTQKLEHNEWL